jgi:hypothetical protein
VLAQWRPTLREGRGRTGRPLSHSVDEGGASRRTKQSPNTGSLAAGSGVLFFFLLLVPGGMHG